MLVILDTSPLGMVTFPKATGDNLACLNWLKGLLNKGVEIRVPEICDYELRRELLRTKKTAGIAKLDQLGNAVGYLPLNTEIMRKASELWAGLRNIGLPTASDDALDGDVILAAQAIILSQQPEHQGVRIVIATSNVKHLARMADADNWNNIA